MNGKSKAKNRSSNPATGADAATVISTLPACAASTASRSEEYSCPLGYSSTTASPPVSSSSNSLNFSIPICVAPDSGVVYVIPMTYSPDPDVSPLASSELSFSLSVVESTTLALRINIINNLPLNASLSLIVLSLSNFLHSFRKLIYTLLSIMYACKDVVFYYVHSIFSFYFRDSLLPSFH